MRQRASYQLGMTDCNGGVCPGGFRCGHREGIERHLHRYDPGLWRSSAPLRSVEPSWRGVPSGRGGHQGAEGLERISRNLPDPLTPGAFNANGMR